MDGRGAGRLLLWILLLPGCAAPWPDPASFAAPAPAPPAEPWLEVSFPPQDSVSYGSAPAFLAGRAAAGRGGAAGYDLVFAIDVSGSTSRMAYGPDEPSDGLPGRRLPRAAPGSILDVEIVAARALLRAIDPALHRVSVVAFSSSLLSRGSGDALVGRRVDRSAAVRVAPLGADPGAIEAAFEALLAHGSLGLTHMAAGLWLANSELVGGPGSSGARPADRSRVVLFLTDGVPTLPHSSKSRNEREVLREADRAARYGVRAFCFAIGPEALAEPLACLGMADRTGGVFTPVRDPVDLPELLPAISYAGIAEVGVRNATTGAAALIVDVAPDGSWSAVVPLAPGPNQIVVSARDEAGGEARSTLLVERRDVAEAHGDPPELPASLAARRERTLERALDRVRRERTRLELLTEVRDEQAAARARAAAQERELEIRADPENDSSDEP